MEAIRKILVALDFTDADKNLFNYARYLAKVTDPESIHFVHVLKPEYAPEDIEESYEEHIKKPLKEQLKDDLEKQILDEFHGDSDKYTVAIPKGQPFEEILKYSRHEDIDLIIAGEKQEKESSGIVPSKLARKAACSILYVPDTKKEASISNVLIPVDFSSYSDLALDFAQELAQKTNIDHYYLQHIYHTVPSYNLMKTYEQMRSAMEANVKEAYERYISKKHITIDDNKIKPLFTLNEKNNPAFHIHDEARKHYCDLIIMGSKGQSNAAAMFVGSTTEKLLKLDKEIPVLILKKKGENKTLLQALFSSKYNT